MKVTDITPIAPAEDFKVTVGFGARQVADLLCTALEGGSNYWYLIVDHNKFSRYLSELPLYPDGWLRIKDIDAARGSKTYILNRASLETGLSVMADNHPAHFADFLSEHDDSTTGDVFLQCCLFGEVIYG